MDAFKLPPVTGKRKLPEEPTDVLLKRYRVDDGSSRERTRIEDVDEGAEEDYEPAGPELPPIDDAEDEEGGRMYGGGVTAEMQRVFEVGTLTLRAMVYPYRFFDFRSSINLMRCIYVALGSQRVH